MSFNEAKIIGYYTPKQLLFINLYSSYVLGESDNTYSCLKSNDTASDKEERLSSIVLSSFK